MSEYSPQILGETTLLDKTTVRLRYIELLGAVGDTEALDTG